MVSGKFYIARMLPSLSAISLSRSYARLCYGLFLSFRPIKLVQILAVVISFIDFAATFAGRSFWAHRFSSEMWSNRQNHFANPALLSKPKKTRLYTI
jgi:hypothetical protein